MVVPPPKLVLVEDSYYSRPKIIREKFDSTEQPLRFVAIMAISSSDQNVTRCLVAPSRKATSRAGDMKTNRGKEQRRCW